MTDRLDLYRTMRTIRRFEERVVDLVNANEIAGVTHEYVGQEAVAAGVRVHADVDPPAARPQHPQRFGNKGHWVGEVVQRVDA